MPTTRKIYLGVNVDHIATIRQARGTAYPDPVELALQAERAGADGITMHLREDRRHIVDDDIARMAQCTTSKLNLEMAATDEMRDIALNTKPADVCIVPESRAELTTEGGLDVVRHRARLAELIAAFNQADIRTSLFIDPDLHQVDASREVGAPVIELHTGKYADAADQPTRAQELTALTTAAAHAEQLGIITNAGHGLHYSNTAAVAAIPQINELNIGHALVAHAFAVGIAQAVAEMKKIIVTARA